MVEQWYAMVVDDPALADLRWPPDPDRGVGPHFDGQAMSFASQEPGDEDTLDRGITPAAIAVLNGIVAVALDHKPNFGSEQWDPVTRTLVAFVAPPVPDLDAFYGDAMAILSVDPLVSIVDGADRMAQLDADLPGFHKAVDGDDFALGLVLLDVALRRLYVNEAEHAAIGAAWDANGLPR